MRKFKVFLSANIEKEEQWLTEMSRKGLQLKKYQFFSYVFEEDHTKSYVYQIDFRQDAKKDYFQLYEDAGWKRVTDAIGIFHYFRADATNKEIRKLYSDNESIQESYRRMIGFYWLIFCLFLVSQLWVFVSWESHLYQYIFAVVDTLIVAIYLYLFYALNKRINYYRKI